MAVPSLRRLAVVACIVLGCSATGAWALPTETASSIYRGRLDPLFPLVVEGVGVRTNLLTKFDGPRLPNEASAYYRAFDPNRPRFVDGGLDIYAYRSENGAAFLYKKIKSNCTDPSCTSGRHLGWVFIYDHRRINHFLRALCRNLVVSVHVTDRGAAPPHKLIFRRQVRLVDDVFRRAVALGMSSCAR